MRERKCREEVFEIGLNKYFFFWVCLWKTRGWGLGGFPGKQTAFWILVKERILQLR